MKVCDMTNSFSKQSSAFTADYALFWTNLSRLNGLLVILNISMFFLTGLINHGYYYTCYSLASLSVVGLGGLLPTSLIRNILYYLCFLFFELIGVYFLLVSIIYWIRYGA